MIHLLAIALIVVVPIAAAALLRACGVRAWPVLGGVLAGIVLGPTIFGRTMPQAYEQVMVGAVSEREQLRELIHRHEADLLAHDSAAATPEAYDELREQHAETRAAHEQAVADARDRHQAPVRTLALAVLAVTLLSTGVLRADRQQPSPGWIAPFSIGLWASLLPGALAYIAVRLWWSDDVTVALFAAATVAIGPWVLTGIDRRIADEAEVGGSRLIRTSGQVASLVAIAAAVYVVARADMTPAVAAVGALLAMVIGWGLPRVHSRTYRLIVRWWLLPTLAALAAVRLDLIADFQFWPVVVLALLSGDGRWIGAFLGAALLGGRRTLTTMALVLGMMATGPTQLGLLALAMHLDVLPGSLGLGVLLGAIYVEASVPLRRAFARRIFETQDELDALDDAWR